MERGRGNNWETGLGYQNNDKWMDGWMDGYMNGNSMALEGHLRNVYQSLDHLNMKPHAKGITYLLALLSAYSNDRMQEAAVLQTVA